MKYQERIIDHYKRVWSNQSNPYFWDKGPIEKLPHDFRILEFPPTSNRQMWTYATCSMSQPEDKSPIELHIFSSVQDTSLVELLTTVVYYHRNTNSLDLNHTVNFGRPWQGESFCEYGFISLPYLDGPDLENLCLSDQGKQIKFYWLIPVTELEVKYKSKFGIAALEKKFDEGLNYIDPLRQSLV